MTGIVFIRAWPRDPATGEEVAIRLAGGGSRRSFRIGADHYRAGVTALPLFSAELAFGEQGWTGGTVPTTAVLGFAPSTVAVADQIATLCWPGARIEIDSGDEFSPARVLTGAVADLAGRDGVSSITVADLSKAYDRKILGTPFAGTGGLEGYAEAEGRSKRRSWGQVYNVEGRLLDPANNIFEFGDPSYPLQGWTALRDKGRDGEFAVVAWQGTAAATLAALIASVPVRVGGVVAPSIACAKWWTDPAGPLTADILGEIGTSYVENAPAIASRLVELAGGAPVSNLASAIGWRPAAAGIHVESENETWSAAIDRLLLGVSLLWVARADGSVAFRRWSFEEPVEALKGIFIERERTLPPTRTRTLTYRINHRVHSAAEISAALLEGEAASPTIRSPALPPADAEIGTLYIDGDNVQYRFEGAPLTFGGEPLTFDGDPLTATPYVGVLPRPVTDATYQIEIVQPAPQTVFTDAAGTPLPSQFPPRVLTPIVKRGGADIRTSLDTSYRMELVNVTATIDNGATSPDKGRISVTDAGIGAILLYVTIGTIEYGPFKTQFTKQAALPAVTGGVGATTAEDSTFPVISSVAYAVVAGPLTVTIGTGDDIVCTFPAGYSAMATGNAAFGLAGRWEVSPAGAGTWTAASGSPIIGSDSEWFAADFSGNPGEGLFNQSFTGLAAGNYDLRFMGALTASGAGRSLEIFSGTARVQVQ